MTTKEKALELANKFVLKTTCVSNSGGGKISEICGAMSMFDAKQCALICVNEIQEALDVTLGHLTLEGLDLQESAKDIIYWQEVKQEIEKL